MCVGGGGEGGWGGGGDYASLQYLGGTLWKCRTGISPGKHGEFFLCVNEFFSYFLLFVFCSFVVFFFPSVCVCVCVCVCVGGEMI